MADDGRFESTNAYVMLFPHVVEPAETRQTDGTPTGKKAYSANFLMAPDAPDFAPLRKMVVDIVKDKFPAKYKLACQAAMSAGRPETVAGMAGVVPVKPTYGSVLDAMIAGIINTPFASGTAAADKRKAKQKDDAEFQRGQYIFKASKPEKKLDGTLLSPPALGGLEGSRAVDYNTPELRAKAASRFFFGAEAFFEVSVTAYTAGSGGVKAYLNQVFLNGKGSRMATGGSPSETFGKHVGGVKDVDPTGEAQLLS